MTVYRRAACITCHGNAFWRIGQEISVNDQIDARGVYFILGFQAGAFNRWEVFILITVTNFTELICVRRIYHHSFQRADYSVVCYTAVFRGITQRSPPPPPHPHPLIRLGRHELHIACFFYISTSISESILWTWHWTTCNSLKCMGRGRGGGD